MKSITFQLTDETYAATVDALTANYGYQPTIDGQPNPESADQFCVGVILRFVGDNIRARQAQLATETARQAALAAVDAALANNGGTTVVIE